MTNDYDDDFATMLFVAIGCFATMLFVAIGLDWAPQLILCESWRGLDYLCESDLNHFLATFRPLFDTTLAHHHLWARSFPATFWHTFRRHV